MQHSHTHPCNWSTTGRWYPSHSDEMAATCGILFKTGVVWQQIQTASLAREQGVNRALHTAASALSIELVQRDKQKGTFPTNSASLCFVHLNRRDLVGASADSKQQPLKPSWPTIEQVPIPNSSL